MIIFDTETTGLPKADAASLDNQPKIIEFGALRIDDDLFGRPDEEFLADLDAHFDQEKEDPCGISSLEFFVDPKEKLESVITKITGIKQKDIDGQGEFASHLPRLQHFFRGEEHVAAHNLPFDMKLLRFDLERIDKVYHFPWPSNHICTVEDSFSIKGRRMRLGELYEYLFKEEMKGWHRALSDVRNTTRILNELIVREYITIKLL